MTTAVKKKTRKAIKKESKDTGIESVLQAYFELAHSVGVDKIVLSQLSEKTGLSPSNVKYHIDNSPLPLETLAVQRVRQSINTYLEENISKDRLSNKFYPLESYAKHMLGWARVYPLHANYLLFVYYRTATTMGGVEVSPQGYSSILNRAYSRIEGLLNEGIGMGQYTISQAERSNLVITFHALVLGHLIILINLQSSSNLEKMFRGVDSLLDRIKTK